MDQEPVLIDLALQGGGSHGAFTWGVLDRLLEDERIAIEGLSGASAGAINAAILAHGLTTGGREGAREALALFWDSVASKALFSFAPGDLSSPAGSELRPGAVPALQSLLSITQVFSPYQFNPLGLDPLRDILSRQIDFDRLRSECALELFVSTTQVSTGTLRLFRTRQITLDVLLASACVPALHRSVRIDGEAYWDGGLTSNPPVLPLVRQCAAPDIVVVVLNPSRSSEAPTDADAIRQRLAEISFGSSLFAELQGIALAKREAERALLGFGGLHRRLRNLKMHLIDSQALTGRLSALSKFNAHPVFVRALRDEGRKQADKWLAANFELLGVRSSFSLQRFVHWRSSDRARAAAVTPPHESA